MCDAMTLTEVLPDLNLFEGTCNVYILRDGDRAVLVDCGSGDVIDHLSWTAAGCSFERSAGELPPAR